MSGLGGAQDHSEKTCLFDYEVDSDHSLVQAYLQHWRCHQILFQKCLRSHVILERGG